MGSGETGTQQESVGRRLSAAAIAAEFNCEDAQACHKSQDNSGIFGRVDTAGLSTERKSEDKHQGEGESKKSLVQVHGVLGFVLAAS